MRDAAELIAEIGEDELGMGYVSFLTISDEASGSQWQGQLNKLFNEWDSLPNVPSKKSGSDAAVTNDKSSKSAPITPSDEEIRANIRQRISPPTAFYEELREKLKNLLIG